MLFAKVFFFIVIFVDYFDFYMVITKDNVLQVLDRVVHPASGRRLVESDFVSSVDVTDGRVAVELKFKRAREPFAASLRRQAEDALRAAFEGVEVSVVVAEVPPATPAAPVAPVAKNTRPVSSSTRHLPGVGRVVAIASGKGGVGKSTVAANLAITLAEQGYRVGILDADIYGPSQPMLFGVEDYLPPVLEDGGEMIVPAENLGVKIMSIGFFIAPENALVWRGPMATNALRQLIHQTVWGVLDYLLVDLPPGTGDVHLSLVQELELDGAVIVSTPGRLALADVKRGVEMFRSEGISVPVLGVVENMAWFTPAELPENKYYIFGEGGGRRFAEKEGVEFLGDIPIVLSDNEAAEVSVKGVRSELNPYYSAVARRIVDKLSEGC